MSPASLITQYALYEEAIKNERITRNTSHCVESVNQGSQPTSPKFSVIMRTQNKRPHLMEQALVCLVAQECQDFEVVVVAHDVDDNGIDKVSELLASFGVQLADRITILRVTGGNRGVPLNVGIDASRGTYVVFLDDDDLVFAHWLSEFERLGADNPGKIVRSRCLDRFVKSVENDKVPSYVQTGLIESRSRIFSLTQHFFISQTVLHSYATPRDGIVSEQSYFDESYPVVEDWDFLLRNAELWGVVDTDSLTCVYNRWVNHGSSLHQHDSQTWEELHRLVFKRFNKRGLLIGPSELAELYRLWLVNERFKNIAGGLLRDGDGLMINKKQNALSRSIQYAQYGSAQGSINSKRQAVKYLVKSLVPQSLLDRRSYKRNSS